MQGDSEHRQVAANFPTGCIARIDRDALKPEFRQHLVVELDGPLQVCDGQIDMMGRGGQESKSQGPGSLP